MRKKIIRNIKIAYATEFIILLIAVIVTIINKNKVDSLALLLILAGIIIFTFISTMIIKNYEKTYDKKMIEDMVYDGKIALAHIEGGTFDQFVNPSTKFHTVIWKINALLYNKDLEIQKVCFYDQFASEQTSIPDGYCYVTYDEEKPDRIFIIPNILVGAFESNKDLVEMYQQKIKSIKYLNVYYKNGLVLETFKDSLKKEQADKQEKQTNEKE